MLFPASAWPGIADGSITVAFRRQKRLTVRAGGTLQSPGGLLAIDEVTPIELDEITDAEARASGAANRDEILRALRPDGTLFRIRFHRIGDDPRVALRTRPPRGDDLAKVRASLDRLPWAAATLRLIGDNPGVVSTELADAVGLERLPFKQRVRRLKALGLTESLKVGYRLSPRGKAVLTALEADPP